MIKPPKFQASLQMRVGEDQMLTVAVTASTEQELSAGLVHADTVAREQLTRQNGRVLSAAAELSRTNSDLFSRAVRAICIAGGVEVPEEFRQPDANGHDAQEGGPHAGDPDRADDRVADPGAGA